jgi:hypothetical protein
VGLGDPESANLDRRLSRADQTAARPESAETLPAGEWSSSLMWARENSLARMLGLGLPGEM